jgi:hypothetical protein
MIIFNSFCYNINFRPIETNIVLNVAKPYVSSIGYKEFLKCNLELHQDQMHTLKMFHRLDMLTRTPPVYFQFL